MEDEIFLRIEDYPGYYVSNLGRVLSLNYNHTGKEGFLKQTIKRGYYTVVLCNKNGKRTFLVHRLVARAFIPNHKNLPFINHKDENKSNNCVDNLEWCTPKYNINYGNTRLKISNSHKKKVGRYNLTGELLQVYDSMKDASKNGFRADRISLCCNKHQKTHKGYIWKFQ